ncbi:hypothetical protein [Pontibacter chinhatensis]|uniref:DUF4136 domain-containing protein n=1 Tax=Pontibacter chinhatensis TaxID=1436961 RepID=A0A1I2YJ44_9BACT|nr:hypothetical protein [Pontibacter chinhatensis]SFH25076.1 hypothetical protein SAMN05421739_10881 [Pontibacter chinhatensis]
MKQLYRKTRLPRWQVFLPLCLLLFAQCTSTRLSLQDGKRIEELGVCLVFAEDVPPAFQEQFENTLEAYMQRYNRQPHAFKLTECRDESALLLRVEHVQYTNSGQRAAGVVVSSVGLIGVPVAMVSAGLPFYLAFWYFPTNQTQATLALSNDIAHPTLGAVNRVYTSGGMFGSDERQRLRHAKRFEKHLTAIFLELETSYKKTARKPAPRGAQEVISAGPVQ